MAREPRIRRWLAEKQARLYRSGSAHEAGWD
jgi:hypothetical protein